MPYKVKTRQGQTYTNVKSWKIWTLDDSFIEFKWSEGKIFIIHFDDIEYIESM